MEYEYEILISNVYVCLAVVLSVGVVVTGYVCTTLENVGDSMLCSLVYRMYEDGERMKAVRIRSCLLLMLMLCCAIAVATATTAATAACHWAKLQLKLCYVLQ